MAKRKKGYRLSIGTGKYTVSGGGKGVRLAYMTVLKKRRLRSLLRDVGRPDLIEQIPQLATRKAGRPKKRR
jgi:hypothetical protein